MVRQCTVCDHPKVEEINRLLLHGETYRTITDYTGRIPDFQRLLSNGIRTARAKNPAISLAAGEVAQADRLPDELLKIQSKTFELLDRAEESNAISSWPGFLREL
jgi:hypothetical protein